MEPNNTNPVQAPMESAAPAVAKKSITLILVVIGVIVLVVLGALYFWGDKILNREAKTDTTSQVTTETVPTTQEAAPKSDDVNSLEADLSGESDIDIDLSGLDTI